jgi:polar amino acid transport system substrate-binding protein
MKYLWILIACLCLVLSVFMAGCLDQTAPEKDTAPYIIGVGSMYIPFTYLDVNGTLTGFDIESAKWIAGQKGFNVTFRVIESRSEFIPALQDGQVDMLYSGMTITPERLALVDFSDPYWTVNQSVVISSGSNLTMDDFHAGRMSLGVVETSTGDMWLQAHMPDYAERVADGRIIYYQTFMLALLGLQAGECDAVVFDDLSMRLYTLGKPIRIIGILETNEEYGIAVRHNDTELLQVMNEGLLELKASPKWDELVAKYMGSEA